jgi:2-beta-glucuronyltransferase
MDGGALRGDRPVALVISSVHDPRMKRRGSIQALADALCRKGFDTAFLSIRFSPLSLMKRDPRAGLWQKGNRAEFYQDMRCYLWRTPFHPFTSGAGWARGAMVPFHAAYANWPSRDVDRMIEAAHVIIIESGLGIVLAPRIRALNPAVTLIYRAADALDTINAHPHLQRLLERYVDEFDHFCLLAQRMAPQFAWARHKVFYVGQALEPADFADIGPSPYDRTLVAVSVGSMLFDADFVAAAASMFPEVSFMVIGCRQTLAPQANVTALPEMKFHDTLPYIAHADIGLAPYREAASAAYLAESSLKLAQYAYLRRPAVCPHFAVGGHPHRFGYRPGNAEEIRMAIQSALTDEFGSPGGVLTWDDALERTLDPRRFSDTAIPDAMFASG